VPDTPTTRLGLYKSKPDGSELVSYTQDIGQNFDKLDLAAGFQACTSSTRPAAPFSGKPVFETDTGYRTYFSNGTSPASGSWVEIPNGAATYNSNLRLASGKQLNIGGSTSTANIAVLNGNAGDDAFSSRLTGDSQSRFLIDADGTLNWGPGGSTNTDVNLYRPAANTLRTADNFTVDLNLSVAGSAAVTGAATVGGALGVTGNLAVSATTWSTYTPAITGGGTVTWTSRTGYYYKLGKIVFVCVYLNVLAAGSGTSLVTIDMPSTVDRTNRQVLTLHVETIGANGNATSSIRGGECVFFTGGTGATSDRLRVDNGTSNESNIQGADLLAGGLLTIQGWYREA
jgi:hypothetical protein